MPAPIIAGAAAAGGRIVAKSVATTTRRAPARKAQRQQADIARQRQIRLQQGAEEELYTRVLQRNLIMRRAKQSAVEQQSLSQKTRARARQVRAVSVSLGLAIILVWLYAAQFLGAMLFFVGYGIEEGFVSRNAARLAFTSGEELALLGWAIAAMVGIIAMLIIALTFFTARINLNRTAIILFGILAFACHVAPYLFVVPWFALWILVIVWNQ